MLKNSPAANSKKLVLATTNQHKVAEIKKMLTGSALQVLCLADFPPLPKVVEDGHTLEANARKKAEAVSRALRLPALADDSGLFVPALHGQPGVKSARYAGPACDYAANNKKLLAAMQGLTGKARWAYFATAMALAIPGEDTVMRVGKVHGKIIATGLGKNGFGYDPVFIPDGESRTFAQMPMRLKNKISHRYLALEKMNVVIRRKLDMARTGSGRRKRSGSTGKRV